VRNGAVLFRERERNGRKRSKWRARGPHTRPGRGPGQAAPAHGVLPWWVPLGCPRSFSAPFYA